MTTLTVPVRMSDIMRERRAETARQIDLWREKTRTSTASEARSLEKTITEAEDILASQDSRIDELVEQEARQAAADGMAREEQRAGRWSVGAEPRTYMDPFINPQSPSFFKDVRNARFGDADAAERLRRNTQERGREYRTNDLSTTAGSGGEFAPPDWLVDQFVALARPGRVAADLATHDELPPGVSSLNLPKVSGGTTTAVQATQGSALSDTAATTTSVTSGITTIGGKQIVANQLLFQSPIPFDRFILGDLAADYAKQLDTQFLSGSGSSGQLRGLKNGASVGATTYTTVSPAVVSTTSANSFYNKVISAAASIATSRYMPATAIVMHPNRWYWVLEALDSQTRPLIVPQGQGVNTVAIVEGSAAQGAVGTMASLPVYIDPNIPTNVGGGTNQDVVYVAKFDDVYLWESPLMVESFDATYADQASTLFRAMAYSALIPDRYGFSVNAINGTGLVAVTL